jgi:hypothetical protein
MAAMKARVRRTNDVSEYDAICQFRDARPSAFFWLIRHSELHALDLGDILQRIVRDGHDIGVLPRLDRAQVAAARSSRATRWASTPVRCGAR